VLAELLADRVAPAVARARVRRRRRGDPRAEAEDLALAHVYVDLREPPLLVYIGDQGHARVLIRRVALPASFDEAAREEVGAIVSSAIDALCAGGTIGIVRARAAPEPPAGDPSRDAARGHAHTHARTAAVERRRAGPLPHDGLGAAAAAAHARARRCAASPGRSRRSAGRPVGRGDHADRRDDRDGCIAARRRDRAGRGLGAVTSLAPRWSQLAAIGGGVDLLRGASGRWIAVPMLQASLGVRATPGRGVVVELHAHVAVDLIDTRVLDAASGQVLLDPWRVRPGISLTFGWSSPR
jgi:hypothetical protein